MRYSQPGITKLSPRSIGVRQGALMMLSTALLVPLVAIITGNFLEPLMFLIPITAIFCFVGGLLRMLYALMMEDPYPRADLSNATGYATGIPGIPQIDASARNPVLPPAPANPAAGWRQRTNTAEIYQPPSITENTTRLLDKDDPNRRQARERSTSSFDVHRKI
jgi:hypothetical protein